jgi:hypothetical protein
MWSKRAKNAKFLGTIKDRPLGHPMGRRPRTPSGAGALRPETLWRCGAQSVPRQSAVAGRPRFARLVAPPEKKPDYGPVIN